MSCAESQLAYGPIAATHAPLAPGITQTVPAAVVQHGPNGTFAYVVNASSAVEMRPIVLDTIQGDLAIVKSGVSVGEQVVVDGQSQLRPGAKVSPRPASNGKAAASASAAPSARPAP